VRNLSSHNPMILLMDDDGILVMFTLHICALHFNFSLQWVFTDDHFRSADRTGFFFHGDHILDLHDILIINSYPLFPEAEIIFPSLLQSFHSFRFPVGIEPIHDHFIVLPFDHSGIVSLRMMDSSVPRSIERTFSDPITSSDDHIGFEWMHSYLVCMIK